MAKAPSTKGKKVKGTSPSRAKRGGTKSATRSATSKKKSATKAGSQLGKSKAKTKSPTSKKATKKSSFYVKLKDYIKDKLFTEAKEEAICPSCGRFVGPYEKCPYCGAHIKKRISLRVFKMYALVMSFVGLIILYIVAINMEPDYINLKNVSESMNYALCKARGIVGRVYIYGSMDNVSGVRFDVYQGNEKLRAMLYRKQAKEAIRNRLIPKTGDEIEITGQFAIKASKKNFKKKLYSMIIQVVDDKHIKILKPADTIIVSDFSKLPRNKDELDNSDFYVNAMLELEGKVVRVFSRGRKYVIILADKDNNKAFVSMWESVYEQVRDKVKEGATLKLMARLDVYDRYVQLFLDNFYNLMEVR